jgi:hypothetical protein
VPSWLTASSLSGSVSTTEKIVVFTVNSNANNQAPGAYAATITFTNTTNNFGTQVRTASLTVNSPVVFNGGISLLSLTAACPASLGLAVGDLATSVYRPRLASGQPESALTLTFARAALRLSRISGGDQMHGVGTYSGHWISDRGGIAAWPGTYNLAISPLPVAVATVYLTIDGTISKFANVANCNVRFRGYYTRQPS